MPVTGKPSQKVVSIAAGEAHTLALTEDGCVYSWGRGTFGRLGTGKEEDELFPVQIKFDSVREDGISGDLIRFVEIAAGAYHSLALQDDGSVWCWGYNTYGQLGLNMDNSLVPRFLEIFLELGSPDSLTPLKVCSIKAGGMMSFAIDNLGGLWMWGNCPPQSSSSNEKFSLVSTSTPIPIWDFHGHSVVKVACGNEHVVALVSTEEKSTENNLLCYSWGNNNHGQLGLGDKESRYHPEIIETFNHKSVGSVYEVACGAFHTAVLTCRRPSSEVEGIVPEEKTTCWTFGLGENGQLGHGTTNSTYSPKPVEDLHPGANLISVDCGLFHTCVVSSDGDVWSWGMEKGLGLCPDASFTGSDITGDAVSPLRIQCDELCGPKFIEPVQVACGAAHTVLLGNNGYNLWAWGRGRSGVLGRGNTIDSYLPCAVMWPPLGNEFEEEPEKNDREVKSQEMEQKEVDGTKNMTEIEKMLSSTRKEVELLRSKLGIMELYTSILHVSVFGKPFEVHDLPPSLQESGAVDIAKEWENILNSADNEKLRRMEIFYRKMLASVKDKIMKRRIQELISECLRSSTAETSVPTSHF